MRKFLLLFLVLFGLTIMPGWAQKIKTSDVVSLDVDGTLSPGGELVDVTVSLTSEIIYAGFNMDIHLPDNVFLAYEEDEGELYALITKDGHSIYKKRGDDHALSFTYGDESFGKNVLRIMCSSLSSTPFNATSGDLFTFTLTASPYAKPGELTILIDGIAFADKDGNGYEPSEAQKGSVTVTSTSTIPSLKITAAGKYSTCILPFDLDVPTGVTAYTSYGDKNDAEGKVYFDEVTKIEAFHPYLLYAPEGFEKTNITGTVDASKHPGTATVRDGFLVGVIENTEINDGYVLQNLSQGVGFYSVKKAGVSFSIAPGKCYLDFGPEEATLEANMLVMETRGTTSLEKTTIDLNDKNNVVYDILGKRVTTMVPGNMYIVNGRKFILR